MQEAEVSVYIQNQNNINGLVDNLDLFDDDLMTLVFKKNIPATELVLSIIMDRKITVTSVDTQEEMRSPEIGGRNITLDIHAIDIDDTEFDVEVQCSSEGAHVRSSLFHSAVMDARMFKEGDSFKTLKDSYVIFIYKHDKFGIGLPIYHVDRVVLETGKSFKDGSHIIYVNGTYKGDDEIGKLIEDFNAKSSENMNFKLLAEGIHHFKETEKGRDIVSEKVERYAKQYAETNRISNLVQNVKNLMKNASFTLDQAFNNLEVSDKDRVIVTKELKEESLRINSMQ